MLYLLPTPIGNLKDITLRTLEILKSVEVIYCENPRHSMRLMQAYEITKHLKQLNQHSQAREYIYILEQLAAGKDIAYISDAGMPGISDPGSELISKAIERSLPFTVLPGSNAILPAVVASGFLSKEFYFAGFLPQKKGRQKRLSELLQLSCPVVFYESPYRVNKLLLQLVDAKAGDRQVCLVRELTKIYEEYIRGTAAELTEKYKDHEWKGEFVVILNSEF